jgi:dethiobiotin synthetase
MKPVATGGAGSAGRTTNPDAEQLLRHINTGHAYSEVNPVVLPAPAAPLIAARQQGQCIEAAPILEAYGKLAAGADVVLVEGVGGWHIQLNENLWMADLVKQLKLPVLMVVGIRLGCINHAILTAEAVAEAGCLLYGWIANHIDNDYRDGNATLELLSELIPAPRLAIFPFIPPRDRRRMAPDFVAIDLPGIRRTTGP